MEANLLGKIDGGESRHLYLRPEFELASGAALDKIRYLFSAHFPHLSNRESVMPANHLILCHSFLLLPSVFPSIRYFLMSQLFTSGSQSIGASASASAPVLRMDT